MSTGSSHNSLAIFSFPLFPQAAALFLHFNLAFFLTFYARIFLFPIVDQEQLVQQRGKWVATRSTLDWSARQHGVRQTEE